MVLRSPFFSRIAFFNLSPNVADQQLTGKRRLRLTQRNDFAYGRRHLEPLTSFKCDATAVAAFATTSCTRSALLEFFGTVPRAPRSRVEREAWDRVGPVLGFAN